MTILELDNKSSLTYKDTVGDNYKGDSWIEELDSSRSRFSFIRSMQNAPSIEHPEVDQCDVQQSEDSYTAKASKSLVETPVAVAVRPELERSSQGDKKEDIPWIEERDWSKSRRKYVGACFLLLSPLIGGIIYSCRVDKPQPSILPSAIEALHDPSKQVGNSTQDDPDEVLFLQKYKDNGGLTGSRISSPALTEARSHLSSHFDLDGHTFMERDQWLNQNVRSRVRAGNRNYYLQQQPDGNLILYDEMFFVYWSSGVIQPRSAKRFATIMQDDGNLITISKINEGIPQLEWASYSPGAEDGKYNVALTPNRKGLMIVQRDNGLVVWSTTSAKELDPPTSHPTVQPTITLPTSQPTSTPTSSEAPTTQPTLSATPTSLPSSQPTSTPTSSEAPSAPTSLPTSQPTPLPTLEEANAPTSPPTPKGTDSPSSPPTKPITYTPGKLTTRENGLLLSEGLKSRIVAKTGRRLLLDGLDGFQISREKFHSDPDGAAVFVDPDNSGGWIYVSNSETEDEEGGVGAIYFDKEGRTIDYRMLSTGTTNNCSGGKTPWNTWVSCEETEFGRVLQVDPTGRRETQESTIDRGVFEAFAYDIRDTDHPHFFVTEDAERGALRRFTPTVANWTDPWNLLHGPGSLEYLVLELGEGGRGTYRWTTDREEGKKSAKKIYPFSEGIDVYKKQLFFTTKERKELFILDLDGNTFERKSTRSGVFDGEPDQVKRIVGDGLLYFCEENGSANGVHARDQNGWFFTVFEADDFNDETTGLAFSPDAKHMYVSFQHTGQIYDIWREDGLPFTGLTLNVRYH